MKGLCVRQSLASDNVQAIAQTKCLIEVWIDQQVLDTLLPQEANQILFELLENEQPLEKGGIASREPEYHRCVTWQFAHLATKFQSYKCFLVLERHRNNKIQASSSRIRSLFLIQPEVSQCHNDNLVELK